MDIWVNAEVTEIFKFDRSKYESLPFVKHCVLTQGTLDALIVWRAQRYLRPAYPDSFEEAFRPLAKKFGNLVKKHEADIDSLLISISPFEELESDEPYEIQLRLMVTPAVITQREKLQTLTNVAQNIRQLFAESPKFSDPKCAVTGLNEMTLWQKRKFLDFSRYDYLSFGKED